MHHSPWLVVAVALAVLLPAARTGRSSTRRPRRSTTPTTTTAPRSPTRTAGSKTTSASRRRSPTGSRPRTRSPFAYLERIPEREAIQKRLTELWNYEKYLRPVQGTAAATSSPRTTACRTSPCSTCWTRSTAEPRVLLDPNTLDEGRHRRPGRHWPSATTASYLAYGVAEAGSDWNTWKVLDVATGKPLRRRAEVGQVQRRRRGRTDGKGFFYSRFPEPKKGETFQSLNLNQKLYYHRLGTPQADDVLVYQRPDQPEVERRRRRHRGRPLPRHHHRRRHRPAARTASPTRT